MRDSVDLPLRLLRLGTSPRKGLSQENRDWKVVSKLWVLGVFDGRVRLRHAALRALAHPARRDLHPLLGVGRRWAVGWESSPKKNLVGAVVVRAVGGSSCSTSTSISQSSFSSCEMRRIWEFGMDPGRGDAGSHESP